MGLGLAVQVAAVCSDPFSVEDVVGVWELKAVNGDSVPGWVTLRGPPETHYITYDQFEFMRDSSCVYRFDWGGDFSDAITDCTYTVNLDSNTVAVLLNEVMAEIDGTFEGDEFFIINSLEINFPGQPPTWTTPDTLIYRRQ